MPVGNPQRAIDRTHRAADAGADRATDHAADRTGSLVAFIRASWAPRTMPCAFDMGDREQGQRQRCRGQQVSSAKALTAIRAVVILFIWISSCSAANAPTGWSS